MHRFIILAFLLIPLSIFSEQPRWGASIGANIHTTCSNGFCQGNTQDVYQSILQSFLPSLSLDSTASYGFARINLEMVRQNQIFLPTFNGHAKSTGPNYHWNYALGVAIEGYRYVGPTNTLLRFTGTLSGRTSANRSFEGLKADVYFFKSDGFTYEDHLPTLLGETPAQVITNFSLQILSTNSGANLTQRVSVPITPNETIYMYAELLVSIFQVDGFTDTDQPFQVTCDTSDNLVSESLLGDQPLGIQILNDQLQLIIPPSRRPFELQQSTTLPGGWHTFTTQFLTNSAGYHATLPASASSEFWRIQWQ